jgi:parallel beta-helix repeat protein
VISLSTAEYTVLSGLEIKNCLADSCRGICSSKNVNDLTIRDTHIHHMSGPAARFSGKTLRFEGNDFHDLALINENNTKYPGGGWPTCMGTQPEWGVTTDKPWVDGVIIRNNRIADCWGEGIGLWYAANAVVEGNTVENAWNVGIYLDNTYNVRIERNFVRMTRGSNGSLGSGILMGSEPYDYWPSNACHDITIVNNVVSAGKGIGWWKATDNAYGPLTVAHNTIVAGIGLNFSGVPSGLSPTKCTATNNVIAEERDSWLGDASAWTLAGNAWLNRPKPAIAGPSDVSLTVDSVPALTSGTSAQSLAALVGTGAGLASVTQDFLCAKRSASAPTRGAFEK